MPFFVIEALDAGGSQTQTDWLKERLTKEGWTVESIHFPQEDRATGRMIYDKFLLKKNKQGFSKREQSLLYIQDFFSRAEDIATYLKQPKTVVVLDRYCTSTFAYQTIGLSPQKRKEMLNWLIWLCFKDTPALPKPDKVLFIDTPVDISLKRLADKKKDYFETKEKLTAIRKSYLQVAKDQKWVCMSGVDTKGVERTREDIHVEIWKHVSAVL